MESDFPSRWRLLGLAVLCEGGLAIVAWLLGWLLGQPALATLRWELRDFMLGLAACVPMLVLFVVLVHWPIGPLRRIKEFCDNVIRPLFAGSGVLDLAIIALLAGVGEEMLFRGVVQPALMSWLGLWTGIILTSALFGLAHPITPTYAVLAAALGVYLGWIWVATESLTVVIVAHAAYDFLALVYLKRCYAAAVPRR